MATSAVSAVVLTYNEEENLEKCLRSLAGRAGEIIVVDSFSEDSTLEIARRFTDRIHQHRYEGHPQQWQWTLDHVPMSHPWVFAVDADFVVTEAVWDDLGRRVDSPAGRAAGYYVRHRQVFRGRPILHGGVYPSWWLRVFRKDRVTIDREDLVDIHFYVDGPTEKLAGDVIEDNVKDRRIAFWVEKQNRFAVRYAREELRRRAGRETLPMRPALFGSPDQRTLWLKERWYRMPLFVRPYLYFFYRYFLRLGFLDGLEGFLYHYTQGFLYRMLVDVNILELRRSGGESER